MEIKYIGIHHFGPSTPTGKFLKSSHLTEDNINNAHRQRWPDFPSEMTGKYIGYNCIIYPNGEMKQYRYIGEETAAQKGHNFDTVSICLAGNFTKGVELPTPEQRLRLKSLLGALLSGRLGSMGLEVKTGTTLNLSATRVVPHRVLQPNHTECYGSGLSDGWAKDLIIPMNEEMERQKMLATILHLCRKLLQLLQGNILGGAVKSCSTADVRG